MVLTALLHMMSILASVVHILIIVHSWVIRKLGLPSWGPRCQDQDSKLPTVERDTYSGSQWWRAVQMKALYVTFLTDVASSSSTGSSGNSRVPYTGGLNCNQHQT